METQQDTGMFDEVSTPVDPALAEAQARWKGRGMGKSGALGLKATEDAALSHVMDAVAERRKKGGAPQPTGVRLKQRTGTVLEIFDDGSVRRQWKRNPELSPRQFRKALKAFRRQQAAAEAKAIAPLLNILPAIPGHRHTFGQNLAPTCGCTYTEEQRAAVRALVAGTMVAGSEVSPEQTNSTTEE